MTVGKPVEETYINVKQKEREGKQKGQYEQGTHKSQDEQGTHKGQDEQGIQKSQYEQGTHKSQDERGTQKGQDKQAYTRIKINTALSNICLVYANLFYLDCETSSVCLCKSCSKPFLETANTKQY